MQEQVLYLILIQQPHKNQSSATGEEYQGATVEVEVVVEAAVEAKVEDEIKVEPEQTPPEGSAPSATTTPANQQEAQDADDEDESFSNKLLSQLIGTHAINASAYIQNKPSYAHPVSQRNGYLLLILKEGHLYNELLKEYGTTLAAYFLEQAFYLFDGNSLAYGDGDQHAEYCLRHISILRKNLTKDTNAHVANLMRAYLHKKGKEFTANEIIDSFCAVCRRVVANIDKFERETYLKSIVQEYRAAGLEPPYDENGGLVLTPEQKARYTAPRPCSADGTAILCTSKKIDEAAHGYNAFRDKPKQVKFYVIFDNRTYLPLRLVMLPGNTNDQTATPLSFHELRKDFSFPMQICEFYLDSGCVNPAALGQLIADGVKFVVKVPVQGRTGKYGTILNSIVNEYIDDHGIPLSADHMAAELTQAESEYLLSEGYPAKSLCLQHTTEGYAMPLELGICDDKGRVKVSSAVSKQYQIEARANNLTVIPNMPLRFIVTTRYLNNTSKEQVSFHEDLMKVYKYNLGILPKGVCEDEVKSMCNAIYLEDLINMSEREARKKNLLNLWHIAQKLKDSATDWQEQVIKHGVSWFNSPKSDTANNANLALFVNKPVAYTLDTIKWARNGDLSYYTCFLTNIDSSIPTRVIPLKYRERHFIEFFNEDTKEIFGQSVGKQSLEACAVALIPSLIAIFLKGQYYIRQERNRRENGIAKIPVSELNADLDKAKVYVDLYKGTLLVEATTVKQTNQKALQRLKLPMLSSVLLMELVDQFWVELNVKRNKVTEQFLIDQTTPETMEAICQDLLEICKPEAEPDFSKLTPEEVNIQ